MRKLLILFALSFSVATKGAVNLTVISTNIPTLMYRGLTYPISVTVKNIGTTSTATTFTINISINTASIYNGSQSYLTQMVVTGGLGAGISTTLNANITIPCTYSTGTRYILVGVNPAPRAVTESTYSDNDFGYSFLLQTAPDLVPLNYTLSTSSITAGNSLNANFAVNNLGGTSAGAFNVGFYLSNSTNLVVNQAAYLGYYSISSLAACSQTTALQKSLTIPASICTGTYYLHMWIDNGSSVGEVYENNNFQYITLSVTGLSPPAPPNATFGDLSTPGAFPSSTTPTLTWTGSGNNFWVQVSKCPYGSSNIAYSADCISGNSHNIPSGYILPGRLYRWNMYAGNACCISGQSLLSNTRYFNVPPVVAANGSTTICPGGSVQLSTDYYPDATYQWRLNGVAISGATLYFFYAALPGVYTVVNSFSCGNTSVSNSISVNYGACCSPTVQVSNINFTSVGNDRFTVNWNNGNGAKRIIKVNTSNSFINLVNGVDPTANSVFQNSGEQVVYNNSGNSVTVTGLTPNITYWVRGFEANCTGSSIIYNSNTDSNNPNSQQTTSLPPPPVANFYSLTPIIVAGQTAQLYDQSSNATSLSWLVEREQWNGSYTAVSSSTQQNPIFQFNTAACYKITLTATNANGSNTLARPCYVYAKPDLNAPVPPDVTRSQSYYTYKGGDPVNLANGSFSLSMRDFSIPSVKTLVKLERRYFSNSTYESVFGIGWHHSFDIKVDFSNAFDWFVQYPDGHNEHYVPYQNGEARSLYPGNFDTLFYTASGITPTSFTLIQKDGIRWNFNGSGQIISTVDLDGNQTLFSYTSGKLTTVILPGGRTILLTYNAFNKVATVSDNINRTVFYYYDATGHKLDSTRIANSTTSFRYATYGMTDVYDPRGNRIVQNIYNTQGQVVEQYDAENKKTTFQYNTPVAGATTVTDPLLKIKVIQHDNKSRCIEIKDELNNIVKYKFSLNNTMDTIIDARNFQTIMLHDEKGNQIKTINAKGFSDSIGYTGFNKPNYIKDKEGNVYKTIYSSTENPTRIILPTADTLKREYDSRGLDTLITDARGFNTKKIYNAFGDLIQTISPTSVTSVVYDAVGRPIEITDSYGRRDSLFWNHFDQLIKRIDKMGRVEEFGFDENGNQILYIDKKSQTTTTQFNKYDKPIRIIEPQNHIVEYEYDDNQRRTKIRNPNKNTLIFSYDDAGREISMADSILGILRQKTYDPTGNAITVTDALNKTWTNVVDEINRTTSTINPLGDFVQWTYNKNNLPVEKIDEEGKSTKWEYDAASRHVKTIDAKNNYVQRFLNKNGLTDSIRDARGNIRNKATYDGLGRLLTLNDGYGNYSMTWDSSGNVKTITDPDNRTLSHFYNSNNELLDIKNGANTLRHYLLDNNGDYTDANSGTQNASVVRNQLGWVTNYTNHYSNTIEHIYDSIGNTKKVIYPGGKSVEYEYNSLNKCVSVKDWTNGVFTILRNNNGEITSIQYSNNFKTEITRDDASRISAWVNKDNANSIFQSNLIRRNKAGDILKDSGIHVLSFLPPLQVSTGTYGRDDRLLVYANAVCTTNVSGQRTHLAAPGKSYSYFWSANSELDSTTHTGMSQSMQYDAFAERTTKFSPQGTTRYIVDHYLSSFPLVLQERSNTDQELINYLYIPREGILLARDSAGTFRFYHHNIKGNTIALSDIAGQITDRYEYNDFEDSVYHTGTSTQPYRWMGMYGVQHDGNGLYYLHARYYDGKTGTFISKDPNPINYLNTQDIDRYVYGYNNPLKYFDPTGLIAQNNISYEDVQYRSKDQIIHDPNLSFWQKTVLIWNNSWDQAWARGINSLKDPENWNTAFQLALLGLDVGEFGFAKSGTTLNKSFLISWEGYPVGGIKPMGPIRLLEGAEYKSARDLANSVNAALRRANPEKFEGFQIHEIQPVKFGGSPTDISNKIFLTPSKHAEYTNFWNALMRSIK